MKWIRKCWMKWISNCWIKLVIYYAGKITRKRYFERYSLHSFQEFSFHYSKAHNIKFSTIIIVLSNLWPQAHTLQGCAFAIPPLVNLPPPVISTTPCHMYHISQSKYFVEHHIIQQKSIRIIQKNNTRAVTDLLINVTLDNTNHISY